MNLTTMKNRGDSSTPAVPESSTKGGRSIAWRARLATGLAVLTVAAVPLAPPVAAASDHYYKISPFGCVNGDCIAAKVEKDAGNVWGAGFYDGRYAVEWTTIVLYQCDGRGQACGAMSSRNVPIVDRTWDQTSRKPYARGHTYKTCVSGPSGSGLVNICTPLMAWNAV